MQKKMLDELVQISHRYLAHEHPKIDITETNLAAKVVMLYTRLSDELEDCDAKIIRHNARLTLGSVTLMMEIERIGLHSAYCLHIDEDSALIATWVEKKKSAN